MFELIRPDLIVFDHSPTAMLASRGLTARRVAIGSGFGVPTDVHPLPNLRAWEPADPAKLLADELVVLERMNGVLRLWHQPPLSRIGQKYSDVDDTFLLTFRELDHYPDRPASTRYRGAWIKAEGASPLWPDLHRSSGVGAGRRLFGYLKPFAGLPQLLAYLRSLGCATLLYIENADPKLVQQFSGPTMIFANKRLDLSQVAAQCDLAIVHGTHGTTLSMLMAGKPTLQLPLFLEQGLFASAVCRLGAALQPPLENPSLIRRDLERMLCSPSFAWRR